MFNLFKTAPKDVNININVNDEKITEILNIVKELKQDNIDLKKIVQASNDLGASTGQLKKAVEDNTPK